MSWWLADTSSPAGTWGAFMAYARLHNVTVETLPGIELSPGNVVDAQFMIRMANGVMRHYVMPRDCKPDRKLGFGRLANICKRLSIPEPDGWPIDF